MWMIIQKKLNPSSRIDLRFNHMATCIQVSAFNKYRQSRSCSKKVQDLYESKQTSVKGAFNSSQLIIGRILQELSSSRKIVAHHRSDDSYAWVWPNGCRYESKAFTKDWFWNGYTTSSCQLREISPKRCDNRYGSNGDNMMARYNSVEPVLQLSFNRWFDSTKNHSEDLNDSIVL